jgi:hypothetical protein
MEVPQWCSIKVNKNPRKKSSSLNAAVAEMNKETKAAEKGFDDRPSIRRTYIRVSLAISWNFPGSWSTHSPIAVKKKQLEINLQFG